MLLVTVGALVNWMFVFPAPARPSWPMNGNRFSVAAFTALRLRLLTVKATVLAGVLSGPLARTVSPESSDNAPTLIASDVAPGRPVKVRVPLRELIAAVPRRLLIAA